MADVVVRILGDAKSLRGAMSEAEGRLARFGKKFQNAGRAMKDAGSRMNRSVTLPVLAIGGAAVRAGANFEQSMNKVAAISGATGKDFENLSGLAKELGRTTQFSASEAAGGLQFLAQAGFETNEMMDALPGTLELAAAGNLELAQAADIASNVLTGYGKTADEIGSVNDILAKTFTSSNTNLEQLGEAMKFVAPVASTAGVQFEETAAAIGLMGNAGIQGSMAGTALRGAISRLLNPSNQAADAMNELGLQVTDSEGKMLPLVDIVRQLEESGADTADMMQIFGQRAGPAMSALVDQGSDALGDFTGKLEDSGGTAGEIADKQMEGLNGALTRAKSALEGAAIAITETGLLDMLAGLAEKVAGLFQKVAEANPTILKIGLAIAAVGAAVGPVLTIVGNLSVVFGALLSPVGLIVAALAGLVAGVIFAYKNFEGFRNVVDGVVRWFKDTAWPAIQDVADLLIEKFGEFRDWAEEVWPQVEEAITHVINVVSGVIGRFVDSIGKAWDMWGDEILRVVTAVWGMVSGTIKNAITVVKSIIEAVLAVINGDWGKAWEAIKNLFGAVWDQIKNILGTAVEILKSLLSAGLDIITGLWDEAWEGIKSLVGTVIDAVVQFVKDLPGNAKSALQGAWSKLGDLWDRLWNAVKNFVSDRVDDVVQFVKDLPGNAKRALETAWHKYLNFWQDVWNAVKRFVSDRVDDVIGFVKDLPGNAKDALSSAWSKWQEFWQGVWREVRDFVSDRVDDVVQFFTDLPGRVKDTVESAIQTLLDLGEWVVDRIWDGIKNLAEGAEGLMGWFTGLPDMIWDWVSGVFEKLVGLGREIVGQIKKGIESVASTLTDPITGALSKVPGLGRFVPDEGDGPGDESRAAGSAKGMAQMATQMFGGAITSGYRTPAQNAAAGGSPNSYHLDRNNPAQDIVTPNMSSTFNWLVNTFGKGAFRELIFGNRMVKNGRLMRYGRSDHWDHIHLAERGLVARRPTLALVGESARARAGGGEIVSPVALMARVVREELRAAGRPVNIEKGAVQLTVQTSEGTEVVETVHAVVDRAFSQLVRNLQSA